MVCNRFELNIFCGQAIFYIYRLDYNRPTCIIIQAMVEAGGAGELWEQADTTGRINSFK